MTLLIKSEIPNFDKIKSDLTILQSLDNNNLSMLQDCYLIIQEHLVVLSSYLSEIKTIKDILSTIRSRSKYEATDQEFIDISTEIGKTEGFLKLIEKSIILIQQQVKLTGTL